MFKKKITYLFNAIFFPPRAKPPYAHICQVGDPVLRRVAEKVPVDHIKSKEIQMVISQMVKVTKHFKCHGLAAPQIGIPLKIILMNYPKSDVEKLSKQMIVAEGIESFPLTVFINPEMKVTNYEKITLGEGCESLRGYSANVTRYKSVQLSGLDRNGDGLSRHLSGWLARIAQHEMDHLEGKLYLDKMDAKTFQNDAWQRINDRAGRIEIRFI